MAIKKYGTEPAKTETRAEDNDLETLEMVKKQGQKSESEPKRASDRPS